MSEPDHREGKSISSHPKTKSIYSDLEGAFSGSAILMRFPKGMFNNLVIVELSITSIDAENSKIDNIGCKYLSKCSFNSMRKFSVG